MSSLVQAAGGLAILYAAKSSPDEKGSIEDQLKEAREWAEAQGLQVVAEYSEENESAYKGDRGPELAAALEHAERAGAILIVQHSDRLARGDAKQARHLVEIALWAIKAEVAIHCVQDPSTFESLVMAAVMGDRNMEDSRRKSKAITAGLARRRKRGQYAGKAPYGYVLRRNQADERVLVPDPTPADVVRRVYAEYLSGRGAMVIAKGLNADGVPSCEGSRWYAATISAMLLSPVYAGLLRDGEHLVVATHEAIIDRKIWEQAQMLRKAKARTHKRGRPSAGRHLFRMGFLRCGVCGGTMVPRTERKPHRTQEHYRCLVRARETDACTMRSISRARIDDAVYAYFKNLGLDAEATRMQLAAALQHTQAEARSLLDAAEQEVQVAAQRLSRVRRDYTNEELSASEWRELRSELEPAAATAKAEAGRLRTQLTEVESEAALWHVEADVLSHLAEIRAEIAKEVHDADGAAAVRSVLLRLFDGFVLHQGPPEQKERDPKKVRHWIEPLVGELTVTGYGEKLGLNPVHTPLAQAKSNFSVSSATPTATP